MDLGAQLFGAWATQQAAAKSPDLPSAAEGTWRLDLPPDPRAARSVLRAHDAALREDWNGVELAIRRLNHFIDAWQPGQAAQAKSLAASSPEDALAAALERIRSPQAKGLRDPLHTAREEFDAFVRRARELVSNYARIETTTGGQSIARTIVGWTGNFVLLGQNDATADFIALHRRNVQLALRRRAMLIRLLVVIGTGAAKIIVRLSIPGAQLLVLPAIWQFVRDVIGEYRRLNDSTRGNGDG